MRWPFVALAFSSLACATSGTQWDTEHVTDIRNCETTAADLLTWFGDPHERGEFQGRRYVRWHYETAMMGGDRRNLTAYLDDVTRVIHHVYNPDEPVTRLPPGCPDGA
jgi:hypothetical protein